MNVRERMEALLRGETLCFPDTGRTARLVGDDLAGTSGLAELFGLASKCELEPLGLGARAAALDEGKAIRRRCWGDYECIIMIGGVIRMHIGDHRGDQFPIAKLLEGDDWEVAR